MPAGFSNFLADGQTIQIDENYRNLILLNKYQLTPTRLITSGSPNVYDVTLTLSNVKNPVVAIRTSTPVSHIATSYGAGTVSYRFAGYSNSQSFTVYIFDDLTIVPGTYGMQVFNDQGVIVFDSSQRYLKVLSSTTFSNYNQSNIKYPVDGRQYAFVTSGYMGYFEDYHDAYETGESFSVRSKGSVFWNMVNGSLTTSQQQVYVSGRAGVGNTSPFTYEITAGTVQIVDVTGY